MFALSGSVVAVRSDMDVVGVVVLGLVTALAGGVMRDLLIADLPPAAVRESGYLVMPLIAAALVIVLPASADRVNSGVLVFGAHELGAPAGATQTAAVVVTVVLRLLALRFDWSAPLPRR